MAIRRLSPITIGLLVLSVGVVSVGMYCVGRLRNKSPAPTPIASDLEQLPGSDAGPSPPPLGDGAISVTWRHVIERSGSAPVEPAAATTAEIAVTATDADAVAVARADAASSGGGRRETLIANHTQRLEEADERAFELLKIPDATRVAIREINRDYRQRTQAIGAGQQPSASANGDVSKNGDVGTNADAAVEAAARARSAAIRALLGFDAARDFDAAERVAVMRLRGKYRRAWGRAQGP